MPVSFRRPNIFFAIASPIPGTFIISLHYKGRDKAILEMDLKLDDLLEKVCMGKTRCLIALHENHTDSLAKIFFFIAVATR